MIPYFEQPVFDLGFLKIHGFGIAVCSALIIGQAMTERRAVKQGLDKLLIQNLGWFSLITGFVVAHLYSIFAYFPERVVRDPMLIFKLWDGISSFGGIVGGVGGVFFFAHRYMKHVSTVDRWRYLDILTFAFPFGWVLGRLGCSMAHDHPGLITKFPLAVSLATAPARDFITSMYTAAGALSQLPSQDTLAGMGFHDLGIYEMLYTLLVIVPVFLWMDRKPRQPGTFILTFILLYSPVRFGFDFLRVIDVRYAGLTAGQFAAIGFFAIALFLTVARSRRLAIVNR
jgi:phosphatidylglycerol:prolipoprotein diacylglycerol transferase